MAEQQDARPVGGIGRKMKFLLLGLIGLILFAYLQSPDHFVWAWVTLVGGATGGHTATDIASIVKGIQGK